MWITFELSGMSFIALLYGIQCPLLAATITMTCPWMFQGMFQCLDHVSAVCGIRARSEKCEQILNGIIFYADYSVDRNEQFGQDFDRIPFLCQFCVVFSHFARILMSWTRPLQKIGKWELTVEGHNQADEIDILAVKALSWHAVHLHENVMKIHTKYFFLLLKLLRGHWITQTETVW